MDFDGTKFGPVTYEFRIQSYTEQQDLTNLHLYRLKFAIDPDVVRKMLSYNGQTFFKLSRGGHVQCRGSNLHEAENIDSQIIVDFNAALSDVQDKDEIWEYAVSFGIRPPSSANLAEVVMMSAGGCKKKGCCENDYVFDDSSLDHRRMEDFIQDKPILTTDVRYLSNDPEQIEEKDLILFTHWLFAFVLKDRKWGRLLTYGAPRPFPPVIQN